MRPQKTLNYQRFNKPAIAVSCALMGSLFQVNLAFAQETTTPTAEEQSIEVIRVTSERRVKRIQDIPNSMTALSAQQLERKSVSRLDDLPFASPGLTVTDAGLTQSVNIRGIGLASGDPDVTNGVGTYIDGLFQPPIVSTLDYYDVEYIQVLRGPQGTFAGANSTGGAIMVDSRRPDTSGDFVGFAKLGLGNYAAKNASGALNIPLTETFAARVAFNYKKRDSFYDSVGTEPTDAGSLDEQSARIGLRWDATDRLNFYLKYETADKDSGGYAVRPIQGTEYADGRTDSIRKLSFNSPTANDEHADVLMLDVNYELTNGIAISWLSGKQDKHIENLYDIDATTLDDSTQHQYVEEKQVSHELNIVSPSGDGLEWVVGAYYQKNDIVVDIDNGPFPTEIDITNQKTTTGIFGQLGYQVTDDVKVEGGLRRVTFEAWADPDSGVVIGRGVISDDGVKVATIDGDYEDNATVGKVSVNWKLSDDSNLYSYVARGYKPGGINSSTSTFDPETVNAFEAGWKGRLLDNNLSLSVAAFYNDYKNFQSTNIDITTGRSDVYNVAAATIKGLEMSLQGQFGDLRVDVAASYVDSELKPTQPIVNTRESGTPNLPQCEDGVTDSDLCFDYSDYIVDSIGGPNLFAPEYSFSLGAEYMFDLANGATLTPRLNYAWIDKQWTNLIYDPETDLLASRGLLSAMMTYEQNEWKVHFYARNLLDKEYVSGQTTNNTEFYGAPRTFGVDVSYTF